MSKRIIKIIFFIVAVIVLIAISFWIYLDFLNQIKQNNQNKNFFEASLQGKNNIKDNDSSIYVKKDFVKILFLGDLMFDRGIRQSAVKNGNNFIFKEVFSLLQNNDLVVSNLEGPITKNKSVSLLSKIGSEKNYIFTFEASLAKTLYENNIRLVNLNNNHILNFGQSGLESTKIYLKDNKVEYFGDLNNLEQKSIIKEISGIKIAFVSYNQFSPNIDEKTNTINEIKRLKDLSDIVILYAHWGNEYVFYPDSNMKELAHTFIDLGVDLIVGSHSHTIVKKEQYKEKMIYYSLGNFVFDQYFNEDVRNGLALEVKIDFKTKELKFKEHKLYLDYNGQTILK
jgi:poly-gamma-glutamate synthesis protein (capsule biosynthesis protein)